MTRTYSNQKIECDSDGNNNKFQFHIVDNFYV